MLSHSHSPLNNVPVAVSPSGYLVSFFYHWGSLRTRKEWKSFLLSLNQQQQWHGPGSRSAAYAFNNEWFRMRMATNAKMQTIVKWDMEYKGERKFKLKSAGHGKSSKWFWEAHHSLSVSISSENKARHLSIVTVGTFSAEQINRWYRGRVKWCFFL